MGEPASKLTERWPLTLVRRGERVGGSRPDYVWWQELPAGEDADALRGVGYEVVEVVPARAAAARIEELERRLADCDQFATEQGRRDG